MTAPNELLPQVLRALEARDYVTALSLAKQMPPPQLCLSDQKLGVMCSEITELVFQAPHDAAVALAPKLPLGNPPWEKACELIAGAGSVAVFHVLDDFRLLRWIAHFSQTLVLQGAPELEGFLQRFTHRLKWAQMLQAAEVRGLCEALTGIAAVALSLGVPAAQLHTRLRGMNQATIIRLEAGYQMQVIQAALRAPDTNSPAARKLAQHLLAEFNRFCSAELRSAIAPWGRAMIVSSPEFAVSALLGLLDHETGPAGERALERDKPAAVDKFNYLAEAFRLHWEDVAPALLKHCCNAYAYRLLVLSSCAQELAAAVRARAADPKKANQKLLCPKPLLGIGSLLCAREFVALKLFWGANLSKMTRSCELVNYFTERLCTGDTASVLILLHFFSQEKWEMPLALKESTIFAHKMEDIGAALEELQVTDRLERVQWRHRLGQYLSRCRVPQSDALKSLLREKVRPPPLTITLADCELPDHSE